MRLCQLCSTHSLFSFGRKWIILLQWLLDSFFLSTSGSYKWISQITYKPQSAGEMVDFETFILSVPWNSNQMCTYFCKDLVTGHYLCLVKGSLICKRHLFPNWFYYLVAIDLMSHEISVYLNAWEKPKKTLNLLVVWSQLWIKSTLKYFQY